MNLIKRLFSKLKSNSEGAPKLWTYDFTVLIFGSFISLAGGNAIVHVLNLFVYDITNNNPLMGTITLAINYSTGVIVPFLAAGFIAKFQKRKLIFGFDYLNAGMLFIMFLLCRFRVMFLSTVFFYCLVFGVVNSVYSLVFKTYLPKLVAGENYSKAYSTSSVISTIAESSIVIGTLIYSSLKRTYGDFQYAMSYIFLFSGALFLLAAIFETRMKYDDVLPTDKIEKTSKLSTIDTVKQVFRFLKGEKILFLICVIGFFMRLTEGVIYGVLVPFFRIRVNELHFLGIAIRDKDFLYSIVMGAYSTGFCWGGFFNYLVKMKPQRKAFFYFLAFFTEKALIICMALLQEPLPMIPILCVAGFAGMISLSMQNVVVYSIVPRELTEQFTGVYEAILAYGYVLGLLGSGVVATVLGDNMHFTYVIYYGIAIVIALAILISNPKNMKQFFERAKS